MKTIKELKNEGKLSTRTYHAIVRGAAFDNKYAVIKERIGKRDYDRVSAAELTVKDIFELWSETEMMHWRGFGPESMSELKGLI